MKEQILSLTGNIMMIPGLIFSVCILLLSLILIFMLEKRKKVILQRNLIDKQQKFISEEGHIRKDPSVSVRTVCKQMLLQILFLTISVLSICFLYSAGSLTVTAKKHGMFQHDLTINQVQTDIAKSPVETKLPDDKTNILVMYYKFGCPDCNAVYSTEQMVLGNTPVYWVSSRSKQGKDLLSQYPVGEVPAGVYINKDGKGEVLVLYSKDKNEKTVLNTANLHTLIDRYNSANKDQ